VSTRTDTPTVPDRGTGTTSHDQPILSAEHVSKNFRVGSALRPAHVSAVDDVTVSLHVGECLGLVGESGCGKSTLGRLLVGLEKPDTGRLLYRGRDVAAGGRSDRARLREGVQMIFQDPYASLDPRLSVGEIIAEPLAATRAMRRDAQRDRVAELLSLVGLPASAVNSYPHQFSGGQRQRIGVARALALKPDVLVCDEPVSALDVSVQAQVVNLLRKLQAELGVALLFISHDLSVVRHIADRVAVMYLGRIAETGETESVYDHPAHPYTRALLSASPVIGPEGRGILSRREILRGEPPSPASPPTGCRFHPRCPIAQDRCRTEAPYLRIPGNATDRTHQSACHFAEQVLQSGGN
jgi:oligopeptide transport system ATP-binding protein